MSMTSVERVSNILRRKPVDRIAVYDLFWKDTVKKWVKEGYVAQGENLSDHFDFDIERCFPFNLTADLEAKEEVVEETEDTIVFRDGNGAILRRHKHHVTTPEHIDFLVKDEGVWQERIKPLLTPDRRRINRELYREVRKRNLEKNRFFICVHPAIVFESVLNICGHEHLLAAMALERPSFSTTPGSVVISAPLCTVTRPSKKQSLTETVSAFTPKTAPANEPASPYPSTDVPTL